MFRVYIYDNNSDDATGDIKNNYSYEIAYSKNSTNIGGLKNIHKAYSTPDEPYIWVIGDDELLPANSIDNVLSIIIRDKPGLIINRIYSHKLLVPVHGYFPSFAAFASYAAYSNPYLLIYHSYISANIIRKDCYDLEFHNFIHGDLYDWLYCIANSLIKNNSAIHFMQEVTLIVRNERAPPSELENSQRYQFHLDTCDSQVKYLNWLKEKIPLMNFDATNTVPNYEHLCIAANNNLIIE